MIKSFRERFSDFFQESGPAANEHALLPQIAVTYPETYRFIERKYGVPVSNDDLELSLKDFCEKYGLPPGPVLFMEIQMQAVIPKVQEISATEAHERIQANPHIKILDVRETWEIKLCKLENSQQLSAHLLDEMLTEWAKETPILVYCHHGIRSLDAATFLVDRGFTNVVSMKGGIEAWSTDVDPSVPQYSGQYC